MNTKQDEIIPKSFIVTIASIMGDFELDLELPADITIGNLLGRLIDILKSIDVEVFSSWQGCLILYKNNFLSDMDTLTSVGAFDGSRLIVVSE